MLYLFKLVKTKLKVVIVKTIKHSLARMSQRVLPKKLVDLAFKVGKEQGDKLILEIDSMRKELLKVIDNDTLITAYNTNSYKRN